MCISDFSAFIQLTASFCAAYVVIGYTKSFMKTLMDNVFSFKMRYCNELDCIVNMIDENSMEQLKNTPSFYRDGNVLLCEGVMSDIGVLKRAVMEFKNSIDSTVESHCRVRGFGSVCAYCFLFAITQLLLIGLFPLSSHVLMKFWLSLTLLSFFLISLYWLSVFMTVEKKGERFRKLTEKNWIRLDNNVNGIILFVGALLLSLPFCFVHIPVLQPYTEIIWSSGWVLSVLLPPVSFIICTLTVWVRARKIQTEISEYKKKKEIDCNQINDRIVKLKNAQEVIDEAAQKFAEVQKEIVEDDSNN